MNRTNGKEGVIPTIDELAMLLLFSVKNWDLYPLLGVGGSLPLFPPP